MTRNVKYRCEVHGDFWVSTRYPKAGGEAPTHVKCPDCPTSCPRAAHIRRRRST